MAIELEYDRGQLPQIFMENHVVEFTPWRVGEQREREFALKWPHGYSGAETLRLTFDVERPSEDKMHISFRLADENDYATLNAYCAALKAAGEAWTARRRAARGV